jgi:hypothetical protein
MFTYATIVIRARRAGDESLVRLNFPTYGLFTIVEDADVWLFAALAHMYKLVDDNRLQRKRGIRTYYDPRTTTEVLFYPPPRSGTAMVVAVNLWQALACVLCLL